MAEHGLTEEEQQAAIDKVLGEPIFDGFSENVYRIRRNLLAFAVLSLVITLNDLSINQTNLPVKGLSNQGMYIFLFLITLYHLVHFAIYVRQYWSQWHIRLTGKKLLYSTSSGAGADWGGFNALPDETHEDTPPHQATLYSWWLKHKKYFLLPVEKLASLDNLDDKEKDRIRNEMNRMNLRFSSGALEKRLKNFDDEFWENQRLQHLNWLIFEVTIPVALGLAALIKLGLMLY